jgi:hypothetical protein
MTRGKPYGERGDQSWDRELPRYDRMTTPSRGKPYDERGGWSWGWQTDDTKEWEGDNGSAKILVA